jgi:predicted Zn-dependent protease with MMP-like domain
MLDRDRYWDCLDQAVEASSGGRSDEALAWLDEALKHNPEGAEAHNGRGEILWDHGRFEEALREFSRAVEADLAFHPARLNKIELLIEEFGEHEEALDVCDELLGGSLDGGVEAEVYYLKAKSLFYLDDLEGALFLLRRAIQVHGEIGVYRGFEGQILFELGDFAGARRSLERADTLEPESAHTIYHMALVLEHQAEFDKAEQLFARSEVLQPDIYPRPVRIKQAAFERAAEEALRSLPEGIRAYVAHCPILIEDLPDGELVNSEHVSPQILGMFDGVPATEPGASPTLGTEPRSDGQTDKILLFKRNLEKVSTTHEELVEQIQITVKHEIGHYLGLDDDDLDRLGIG